LKEKGEELGITEVNPITEAHTPMIELKILEVAVDLGFAQVRLPTLSKLDSLLDDSLLVGVDEKKCARVKRD